VKYERRWSQQIFHCGEQESWDAAVVVPARDEAGRIGACLRALAESIGQKRVGVVVVTNNCTDNSAQMACQWLTRLGIRGIVVDCTLLPAWSNAGRARDIGLSVACRHLGPRGHLMMTDADSRVASDWVEANLAELETADVVCGRIEADPDEEASLPARVIRHALHEHAYLRAALRAVAHLDPLPHDPAPSHRSTPGASLAFRAEVYRRVGMLPLAVGEDGTFVARAEQAEFRVRYSDRARVVTSCRMTGRTGGGMAGTLRHRATDPDPLCDPWLEPAQTLVLRYRLRGCLRRAWPDRERMGRILRENLGDILKLPDHAGLGAIFATVETRTPALARRRIRQSELSSEIRHLQRLHAEHSGTRQP
jgi:hypothetical protein